MWHLECIWARALEKILSGHLHKEPSSMQGAFIVLVLLGITSGRHPVHCEAMPGLIALQNTIL